MKIKVERRTNSDRQRFFNGTFKESFDALDTSNGTVITLTLNASDAAPLLTMQFSDGLTPIATPATIELTAGTDDEPQKNYIYIPKSTKVLTKSTSSFPDEEHIPVIFSFCPSATHVQSEGCYINQNWNDHLMNGNNQGHLSHIGAAIRLKTGYFSGFDPAGTDQSASSSYMDYISGSESYFKYSSGKSRQMHLQDSPAFDSADAGDDVHIINWSGDSYHEISDLTDIQADSTGTTLSNKYFNIFFFATVNKEGQYHPVMAKLPSGSYVTASAAQNDENLFDDLTMPREFNIDSTVGVPLCRITFRYSGGLSSLTHISTSDLRRQGLFLAGGGGGGGGVTDHGALTGLEDDDHTQYHNDARAETWLAENHETTYTHSDIALNTTHRSSDGSDHSFIDQSVISGATPTFVGTNFTDMDADDVNIADAGAIITATEVEGALQENRTAIDLNTTHSGSDGTDHSEVVTNVTHRGLTNNPHSVDASDVGLGNVSNVATDDTAYNATSWNANLDAATKNAIRDKIETMDTAIGLNTAKDTNVSTSLSLGTRAATTMAITSDGGADDVILLASNTTQAGLMTDAQFDKLAAIEDLADVTDTANVTSAGALMDSEVDADIKTLVLPASTTISTFGASLVDDADAAAARTTLGISDPIVRKTLVVESPTSSENIGMFFTEVAITVTEIRAVLVGSSTPSVSWTVKHSTDRSAAGNAVVTAGTTTTSTTTGSDVTSFDDATIPANSFVWLETTAQSGTVTAIEVTVIADVD